MFTDSSDQKMLPRGNDQFNGRFDFFEWSAPYYRTPKEVFIAVHELQITGKTIKAIHVIGTVFSLGSDSKVCTILSEAGMDLSAVSWKDYTHLDDVKLPWGVTACEPIQFIFEDNTTFEILPIGDGGARLAVNSIPVEITDGLNRSNLCPDIFFAEFVGKQIKEFEMYVDTATKNHICKYSIEADKEYNEKRTTYRYRFNFDYPYEINLEQGFESYYDIKARGEGGVYDKTKIRYRRVKDSVSEIDEQVFICNGRDAGGTFWIVPINSDRDKDREIPFFDNFGMAIDDYYIEEYLSEFLYRYFDPSIQKESYYPDSGRGFDWYGVNLYTYESMKKMIADIRRAAGLLASDYDNPELDKIKAHFPWHPYTDKHRDALTDAEMNELRKNGVPMAIDFYQRFVDRIEKMMALPGTNTISFAGP